MSRERKGKPIFTQKKRRLHENCLYEQMSASHDEWHSFSKGQYKQCLRRKSFANAAPAAQARQTSCNMLCSRSSKAVSIFFYFFRYIEHVRNMPPEHNVCICPLRGSCMVLTVKNNFHLIAGPSHMSCAPYYDSPGSFRKRRQRGAGEQ